MTAIILQGPLSPISLGTIGIYQKYGPVIISCWADDDLRFLDLVPAEVKVIINPKPDMKGVANPFNIYYQICSTFAGLQATNEEYCIKFRSDESYSNLDYLVQTQIENPQKILSSNIYFSSIRPLHISDHIIAGKTKIMLEAYRRIKLKLERNYIDAMCPEMIITRNLLEVMGEPRLNLNYYMERRPNTAVEVDMMIRNFVVIPVGKLGQILCRIHSGCGRIHIAFEDRQQLNYYGGSVFSSVKELLPVPKVPLI